MSKELKKGAIDLCLLALVADQQHNGVELIEKLGGDKDIARPGSVYPALARLERLKYVKGERRLGSDGRTRKFFTITSSGQKELVALTLAWRDLAGFIETLLRRAEI